MKSLRTISRFTKKHYCNAIFAVNDGASLAVLKPSIDIPEDIVIEGRSEIIGKVLRVGGKTPKALIETTDGSLVYCDVGKEEAKSMGHMLGLLESVLGILGQKNSSIYILIQSSSLRIVKSLVHCKSSLSWPGLAFQP